MNYVIVSALCHSVVGRSEIVSIGILIYRLLGCWSSAILGTSLADVRWQEISDITDYTMHWQVSLKCLCSRLQRGLAYDLIWLQIWSDWKQSTSSEIIVSCVGGWEWGEARSLGDQIITSGTHGCLRYSILMAINRMSTDYWSAGD